MINIKKPKNFIFCPSFPNSININTINNNTEENYLSIKILNLIEKKKKIKSMKKALILMGKKELNKSKNPENIEEEKDSENELKINKPNKSIGSDRNKYFEIEKLSRKNDLIGSLFELKLKEIKKINLKQEKINCINYENNKKDNTIINIHEGLNTNVDEDNKLYMDLVSSLKENRLKIIRVKNKNDTIKINENDNEKKLCKRSFSKEIFQKIKKIKRKNKNENNNNLFIQKIKLILNKTINKNKIIMFKQNTRKDIFSKSKIYEDNNHFHSFNNLRTKNNFVYKKKTPLRMSKSK